MPPRQRPNAALRNRWSSVFPRWSLLLYTGPDWDFLAMGEHDGDNQFYRAISETLDSVVAPGVRDAVIVEALTAARRDCMPSDSDAFYDFVQGPLRIALTRAVGGELGDSIADELARVAEIASSRPPVADSFFGEPGLEGPAAPNRSASAPRSVAPAPITQPPPRRGTTTEPTGYARNLTDPPRRMGTGTDPVPDPVRKGLASAEAPPAPGGEAGARLGRLRSGEATLRSSEAPAEAMRSVSRPLSRATAKPPSSDAYPKGIAETIAVRGAESDRPNRKLPFVLVATLEPQLVRQLAAWLDPRAAVVRVRGPLALLHDLENSRDAPTVIIIDCRQPSVRPAALAGLVDDFPDTVRVVMWGASAEVERQVVSISERARGWFVCSAHAEPRDVAERCAQLVR
jgi:hypothetical protein